MHNIIQVSINNELEIFNFEENQIRMIVIAQEVWFVAKDVAEILGYKNTKDVIKRHVDFQDKDIIQRSRNTTFDIPAIPLRGLTIINESGLFSLILASKLETARKFKRWITSEVLPSIRKKGFYQKEKTDEEKLSEAFIIANNKMLQFEEKNKYLAEENQILEITNEILEIENKNLKLKNKYTDIIIKSNSTIKVTQIAQDYGKSAIEFNLILKDLKIQYKLNGQWILYNKYKNKGFTNSGTWTEYTTNNVETTLFTTWTQKGRFFLYNILKKNNILPTSEKL